VHILVLTALRGLTVRGPTRNGHHAFVLVRDWLGDVVPPSRDLALGELARRYLVSHAPADERDLAKWAAITLGDARHALTSIRRELTISLDGLVNLTTEASLASRALPSAKLLGQYDPVLLGWTSRAEILGRHHDVVTTNGLFRPFVMVRGRAVGTWSLSNKAVRLDVRDPITASSVRALRRESADIERFFTAT
jgi:hypothetical protein